MKAAQLPQRRRHQVAPVVCVRVANARDVLPRPCPAPLARKFRKQRTVTGRKKRRHGAPYPLRCVLVKLPGIGVYVEQGAGPHADKPRCLVCEPLNYSALFFPGPGLPGSVVLILLVPVHQVARSTPGHQIVHPRLNADVVTAVTVRVNANFEFFPWRVFVHGVPGVHGIDYVGQPEQKEQPATETAKLFCRHRRPLGSRKVRRLAVLS